MATKSEICRLHGLTRYAFDGLINAGMPFVAAPRDKGGEWQLDPAAVADWVREREARAEFQRRLQAQRVTERRAEAERQAAERHEAELEIERRQREAEQRRHSEAQQRRENEAQERALDDAYSACFRLAMKAYKVTTGPGWP